MKPFLLLASRDHDHLAEEEYQAFLRFCALEPSQLHRVRLEAGDFPEVDLERYSGIILGGSPFNSSDPAEEKSAVQRAAETWILQLLDRVVAADFPFLGACYGVGTLGIHQGGTVDRTAGEDVGAITVSLTEDGRCDPLLAGMPEQFAAYVGHKEGTSSLPAHAVLLATGEDCHVQMYRIKENLYATQFHPELDPEGLINRIRVYKDLGYFRPQDVEIVEQRVTEGPSVEASHRVLAAFVERYAVAEGS